MDKYVYYWDTRPAKITHFSVVHHFVKTWSFSTSVIPNCSEEQDVSLELLGKAHDSVSLEKRHHTQAIVRYYGVVFSSETFHSCPEMASRAWRSAGPQECSQNVRGVLYSTESSPVYGFWLILEFGPDSVAVIQWDPPWLALFSIRLSFSITSSSTRCGLRASVIITCYGLIYDI